mgnify:CR=1 FL=1
MYICIYINIYIYRRANGIYIQKSCSIWTVCPCFYLIFIFSFSFVACSGFILNKMWIQKSKLMICLGCAPCPSPTPEILTSSEPCPEPRSRPEPITSSDTFGTVWWTPPSLICNYIAVLLNFSLMKEQ